MFALLITVLLAIVVWGWYGPRPKTGFLPDFAKLLDRPEFVDNFENRLIERSFLKGEFRGRKVVILLQEHPKGKYSRKIVISMETHATAARETYEFAGWSDRDSEQALFALEVDHDLKLRHEDGCLKARWVPQGLYSFVFFPPDFDAAKWQSVLEAMVKVAGGLERRAA